MISIVQVYGSMLLVALGRTLLMTVLSLVFAMVIGMVFGLMNVGHNRILNCIGTIYVDAVRGVPLIVLAYFIYFGVPAGLQGIGFSDFRLSGFQAGFIALSMNCGAYMAEIIRAGIESVDRGQMEAGRSLGFGYVATMRYIILPQAFKAVLPTLANEFIVLLKETAVAGYVGLTDVTYAGNIIGGNCYDYLFPLLMSALIYLILVMFFTFLVGKLERRLRSSER